MAQAPWLPIGLMAALIIGAPEAAGQDPGAQAARPDSAGFVAGISDLPLMAGLEQQADGGVFFDKPGGRIVEVVATGPLSGDAIAEFYATVLPEFGWRRDLQGEQAAKADGDPIMRLYFERDGERLGLTITLAASEASVRFSVTPVGR